MEKRDQDSEKTEAMRSWNGRSGYVLAVDQSTQGTKAMAFDETGKLVSRVDLPHRQLVNEKGWVSHDLEEIYRNTIEVLRRLLETAGIREEEIVCLSISSQRETSAAWDRETGKALAPAIVWQCGRAEGICREMEEYGELIRKRTGLRLSPYFPAAKYAWLSREEQAVKEARKKGSLCFGTIDSWLLFKLCGVYKTDLSNASRTQLFNIHTLSWDEEICRLFGIRERELPALCDSNAVFGETDLEGLLKKKLPVCGVMGDSQGALFGQGCLSRGMVKATYGTGSSVMMNIGEKPCLSENGLVTSLGWGMDGEVTYVMEGNINYSGAVITWLRDEVGLISSPGETEELARQANQNDTAYLVPAFSGLGAPYWKPEARAVLCGMGRTTGKKEIVKAAVESIAYQITDVVKLMEKEAELPVKELCVDGGAIKNRYLMEFQSGILGIPVRYPVCEESSAFGCALMGGLACGFYREGSGDRKERDSLLPAMGKAEQDKRYSGWKKAVKQAISE